MQKARDSRFWMSADSMQFTKWAAGSCPTPYGGGGVVATPHILHVCTYCTSQHLHQLFLSLRHCGHSTHGECISTAPAKSSLRLDNSGTCNLKLSKFGIFLFLNFQTSCTPCLTSSGSSCVSVQNIHQSLKSKRSFSRLLFQSLVNLSHILSGI